jgi:hypothetical protein
MKTKLAVPKKLAIAVFTLCTLLVCLSLSAQGQKRKSPPDEPLLPPASSECDAVGDNLVVNCGFESGDFAGWQVLGTDTVDMGVNTSAAHTGTFGAYLGSVGGLGCIYQRVATTPGQPYTLSFWLANSGRPNNFQVFWGGGEFPVQVSGDMMNMPDFGYTKYSLPLLAGSGGDPIMFCAENDPAFFFLDDIVVH